MNDIDAAATADFHELPCDTEQLGHNANSVRETKRPTDIADAAELEHLNWNIPARGMLAQRPPGRYHQ